MAGWPRRLFHYLVILGIGSLLLFPNLGSTSLWDVDEGVNAEAAREMREAETWIVPTFNWELRTAKPVFLYWLQILSYNQFGVNEWSARFPSVILGLLTLLVVYELGRSLFDSLTGLLGALILASSIEFCKLAHAATPDSTLIFFITLYFLGFQLGHQQGGRSWFLPCGVASAFGMLTKGPIGLVLPGAVVGLYFLLNRETKRVLDHRMISGVVAWVIIAVPWYGLVTAETRGEWTKAFFLNENLGRAANVKENHSGWPVVYYLVCICLFFAPWSAFLWQTLRTAVIGAGLRSRIPREGEQRAYRLLLSVIVVTLLAFSFAATKLPNYIAPLYPALALLTARFLLGWYRGEYPGLGRWMWAGSLGVGLTGFTVMIGLLIGGGVIPLPMPSSKVRVYPGLEDWAWIGMIPLLGSVGMMLALKAKQSKVYCGFLIGSTIIFVATLAAFPLNVLDQYKSAKELSLTTGARNLNQDILVGSFQYSQPSVVFYLERRVEIYHDPAVAASDFAKPLPFYLFVPQPVWNTLVKPHVRVPYRIVKSKYDYTRNTEILVIHNLK
jgi:4-amino-4-deoxy-L-arabinose transferase-like glycosyltransferase